MFTVRKLILFGLSLLLAGTLSLSVPHPQEAQANPGHIVYNLYATDGYIQLADGTKLYMYGFIGGREGQNAMYQNSVIAPPKSPKTYVPGGLVQPIAGNPCTTWQAPGANPACEAQLAGNAQFPAPIIYAAVGDTVEIRLKNLGVTTKTAPNDPHSIHLHGLDVNAANDGVPETSVGAIPANAAMLGAGNVIVYYFTPTHAGTYMYHCHQEADIHVQMGMFGALVVYNPGEAGATTGPGTGGGTLMGWNYTKDYVLLLSEFDVNQHISEQQGLGGTAAFNPVNYHPQYWTINGLSFPQTIHVAPPVPPAGFVGNWFSQIWLPAHPGYDPLIVGSVGTGTSGDKVLLRMINMGFETQPMHMHGFHGKIIGSDQRAWTWSNDPINYPTGSGLEKNTLTIGSGETYEWLLDFNTWAGRASGTYPAGLNQPPPGDPTTFTGGTQSRYYNGTPACQTSLTQNGLAIPAVLNAPVSNVATGCPAILDPLVVPPGSYIGGPTVGPIYALNNPEPLPGSVPGLLLRAGGFTAFDGQLFPFHNHDDYKATNNGVYPGGMFTMIATVP